ncbi:MAG: NRDE family protein [Casimicrobium sp.]
MCIAVFQWNPDAETPILLAANRDEHFERPTQAMHWWPQANVLAGRDLKADGAWLGVTRQGIFALITNIRNPALLKAGAPSRGQIVRRYLEEMRSACDFVTGLAAIADHYEGFNLLCGSIRANERELWFLNSSEATPRLLDAGIYAVSNASLDTPWPKITRIKAGFRHALAERDQSAQNERLFRLLGNTTQVADHELPQTGVPLDWERKLSSISVRREGYGTRASTVMRIGNGHAEITELNHNEDSTSGERKHFTFDLQ